MIEQGGLGMSVRLLRPSVVILSSLISFLVVIPGSALAAGTGGLLDLTFGSGGKVLTDFSGSNTSVDDLSGVAIQGDGKIVASGTSDANGSNDFALARYNADGSLDTTFG